MILANDVSKQKIKKIFVAKVKEIGKLSMKNHKLIRANVFYQKFPHRRLSHGQSSRTNAIIYTLDGGLLSFIVVERIL